MARFLAQSPVPQAGEWVQAPAPVRTLEQFEEWGPVRVRVWGQALGLVRDWGRVRGLALGWEFVVQEWDKS
jgi:hypothetical protein